jgi:hypothetical protein
MKIEAHNINDTLIAEVTSDVTIINKTEDGLDLIGNLYFQGFDRIVIYEKNITPDFFDLKNGIAGEILQKFSTYRIRLDISVILTPNSGILTPLQVLNQRTETN